jgi:hypothetical protein
MTDTEEIRAWWQKTISEEFIPSEPPESIGLLFRRTHPVAKGREPQSIQPRNSTK